MCAVCQMPFTKKSFSSWFCKKVWQNVGKIKHCSVTKKLFEKWIDYPEGLSINDDPLPL